MMIRIHQLRPYQPRRRQIHTQMLTVKRFQYKYAFFLTVFAAMMSLAVGGTTIYLLNHNYHLLVGAELLVAPRMVDGINHELKLANEILLGVYTGFIIFMGMVGFRVSRSIVIPLFLIQEKMRGVCRGEMSRGQVQIRYSDQFQEFAETYNYMIESLNSQLKRDIERLKQLKPDDHNRDAIHLWQTMISEKEAQITDTASFSTDQDPVLHHVS